MLNWVIRNFSDFFYQKSKHFHSRRCLWKCHLHNVSHFVPPYVNSLWSGDAIWWQRSRSILRQVMFFYLKGTKPLPELMLIFHWRYSSTFDREQLHCKLLLYCYYKFENHITAAFLTGPLTWPWLNGHSWKPEHITGLIHQQKNVKPTPLFMQCAPGKYMSRTGDPSIAIFQLHDSSFI